MSYPRAMPSRSRTQSLAGSLGTPHVSYVKSINKDKVLQISNEIAANALNIKRIENKNFWQTAPRIENSRVLHTKNIYTIERYNIG
jgi:hypothetical protein